MAGGRRPGQAGSAAPRSPSNGDVGAPGHLVSRATNSREPGSRRSPRICKPPNSLQGKALIPPCLTTTQRTRGRVEAESTTGHGMRSGSEWGGEPLSEGHRHGHSPRCRGIDPGGSEAWAGHGPERPGQGAVGVWGSSAPPAAQPRTRVPDPSHPGLRHGLRPTTPWERAAALTRRMSPQPAAPLPGTARGLDHRGGGIPQERAAGVGWAGEREEGRGQAWPGH